MTPTERLTRLWQVAKCIDPAKFEMAVWCRRDGGASEEQLRKELRDPACGTTACLAGWGACDPELHADGLGHNWGSLPSSIAIHGNAATTSDLADFFGLSVEECRTLFFATDVRLMPSWEWPRALEVQQNRLRTILARRGVAVE